MSKIVEPKEIVSIDQTITAEKLEDNIYAVYSKLFKDVKKDDLKFEELYGGNLNSIIRVYSKDNKSKDLVFRTFGLKLNAEKFTECLNQMKKSSEQNSTQTDKPKKELDFNIMLNRLEYQVMDVVSKHNLCEPVYARYNNGVCYGFSQGVTLNGSLMLTNDFLNEMTTKLARFHSIKFDLPDIKFETHYQRQNSQFGPMVELMVGAIDSFTSGIDEFPYNKFPKISSIIEIEKNILNLLTEIGFGEILFCHNDINQKNLIWEPQTRKLSFIDFEMSMNNYVIFEIGQLFCSYTGQFLFDFEADFFPNYDYRRRFLKKYLTEKNKINSIEMKDDQFEEELEKLFLQADLAALYFMCKLISMTPFFDFKPELYNNAELEKTIKETKYYFGKYGYKVYVCFKQITDEILKSAEEYLKKRKQN